MIFTSFLRLGLRILKHSPLCRSRSYDSRAGEHLLDSLITEHGGFKRDIELIEEFMEGHKRGTRVKEHSEEFSSDDDGVRSVATPHESQGVDGENKGAAAQHEDRRRSGCEVCRLQSLASLCNYPLPL